jgi:transcriptional regulator with XRE-family HTH domain
MAQLHTTSASLYAETGRRIRDLRREKGLSQARLAAAVDLSRTSITNIERGRQKLLLHTLQDIANALGVESQDLLPRRSSSTTSLARQLPSDVPLKVRNLISKMVERQTKPKHTRES